MTRLNKNQDLFLHYGLYNEYNIILMCLLQERKYQVYSSDNLNLTTTHKNGNSTTNLNNRPKSDRLIMTSNGPKPILSIDHNPVNSSNSGYQKNNIQSQNAKLDYPSSRPISRRGRQGQERPGVITTRPPLSLMKLPPLDSNVSKRAERIALTTTRETCV